MHEPFEDSRRLTGANLYFDGAGAALETAAGLAFDAGTLQLWRANVARSRTLLGWPESAVVVEARLQLAHGDRSESERMISEIVSWRRANQPGGQNAGSVFVNPVPGEVTAGALIDAAGLRGLRVGSAHVSEKHANFIQVDDGGSADDVHALMQIVRDRVESTSGYALRTEIRLVGFRGN